MSFIVFLILRQTLGLLVLPKLWKWKLLAYLKKGRKFLPIVCQPSLICHFCGLDCEITRIYDSVRSKIERVVSDVKCTFFLGFSHPRELLQV